MATIPMQQWTRSNGRSRVLPSDKWYLDFSESLLPLIEASPLFSGESRDVQTDAALRCGMYFQDAIAQTGGWKEFTAAYRKLYGTYLPFYPLTEAYVADEINREDIAFLLWSLRAKPETEKETYTLFEPYDSELLALSQRIYEQMDARFEEAPISEKASSPSWVMPMETLAEASTPLPESTPATRLSPNAAKCLAYNQGKPLLYFADYAELRRFFVHTLEWEDKPSSLLLDLKEEKEFVIYANAKGMLLAPGVAAYFREAHNPMYDSRRAAEEGYRLFCQPGACPFDLLKYGMAKGILPDVALPFPKGKETLHTYWDFIARYYLNEYYEGK